MGGEGDQNPQSLRAKMTKFQIQTKLQLLEGSDNAKGQSPWATMAISHICSISVGSSRAAINWEEETLSTLISVPSGTLQPVRLRMPRDSHTGGHAAVQSCLGMTLPTCSVETGASQHCPKLGTKCGSYFVFL